MTPDLDRLPGLPRDDDGPVFAEPWQARAFALAVRLHEEGRFTWPEWTDVLAAEIQAAQRAGDPDLGDTYWDHWVRALERLVADRQVLEADEVDHRTDRWRRAYLATPHGQPVHLSAAEEASGRDGT